MIRRSDDGAPYRVQDDGRATDSTMSPTVCCPRTFFNSNLHNMIKRFDIGTRMSEMVVHNGTVYLSGQVATDSQQDIEGQTRQVLEAIDGLLARAATDKSQLLTVQIYLVDMADFDGMNRAWDAWVPVGHVPTRATVQASLARPEWKLEIVATAALPDAK